MSPAEEQVLLIKPADCTQVGEALNGSVRLHGLRSLQGSRTQSLGTLQVFIMKTPINLENAY